MTLGFAVMLIGVFVVPIILLWVGHRLRRRSTAIRGAFWGGVAGHLAAIVIGSVAAMIPPANWSDADMWRGLGGFWAFLILPLIGAGIGAMRARR